MLNKPPNGWRSSTLNDIAEYINGRGFKPREWGDEGLPIIRIEQINKPDAKCDYFNGYVAEENTIQDGDLLFSWSATLTTLIWNRGPAALNQHIFKVLPKNGNRIAFIHHLIDFNLDKLAGESHGTTMKHITRKDLNPFVVVLPEADEQSAIAKILDSIDERIRKTEKKIAKLQKLKDGLLHDLLTRGIGEDGKLRDPVAHPEQFKESELGRIPKSWNVVKLVTVVPKVEYGISESLGDTGIPILRMQNLFQGEAELTDLKYSDSKEAAALLLKPDDVLFNRTNSIEHVGRTGIWRAQLENASFASYLVRLIPDKKKILPDYLNFWMNWTVTQNLIRRYATPAVQQVNINPTNLRKARLSLPDNLKEQKKIIQSMFSVSSAILGQERLLTKLTPLKQGLLNDLLTGTVRTTPLLAKAA